MINYKSYGERPRIYAGVTNVALATGYQIPSPDTEMLNPGSMMIRSRHVLRIPK